jgi:hypothetical protein
VQPPIKIKAAIPEDATQRTMVPLAESVVDIGLASSSRTMKGKALARVSVYSMHDLVKGRALVRIEVGNVLIFHLLLLILIIISLLHEMMIPQ